MAASNNWAQKIRSYVAENYIAPARRRGERRVRIVAGDIHRGLHLKNLVPNVCQVLDSKKFREEYQLEVEKKSGPPSGMGTRMTYVYRLLDDSRKPAPATRKPASTQYDGFLKLRGLMKETFQSLGGGEAFVRRERENFYGDERDEK